MRLKAKNEMTAPRCIDVPSTFLTPFFELHQNHPEKSSFHPPAQRRSRLSDLLESRNNCPTTTYDHVSSVNFQHRSFTPTGSVIFSRPGFGQIGRRVTGQAYTVEEASINEYPADTANPRIMANLEEFARMLSVGQYANDGQFYPASEWEDALQKYQDGVSDPSNMCTGSPGT